VAEITIGVPVSIGMSLFRESLECGILWIFNNASSDDTPQFGAADSDAAIRRRGQPLFGAGWYDWDPEKIAR
jgi:hypothetical protein